MPFVTKSGGLCFDDGVIQTHRNDKGELIQGNGLTTQILASVGSVGLDQESEGFKKAVIRGNPRANGTSWDTTPVFIVQHYEFDDKTWDRFLANFEKTLTASKRPPKVIYEPTAYDIIDIEYGDRQLPLWVLEWLEERDVFKKALNETKVESTHKKLNPAQYELIIKALAQRKVLAAAEVAETAKADAKKEAAGSGKKPGPKSTPKELAEVPPLNVPPANDPLEDPYANDPDAL